MKSHCCDWAMVCICRLGYNFTDQQDGDGVAALSPAALKTKKETKGKEED
jgi:hypothetical protein